MQITRLHLLLFLLILGIVGLYIGQKKEKYIYTPLKTEEQKQIKPVIVESVKEQFPQIEKTKKEEIQDLEKKETEQKIKETGQLYNEKNSTETKKTIYKLTKKSSAISFYKYTVSKGDCLWNISKKKEYFGKGSMWYKIWRKNQSKIKNFDIIYPGQKLIIPVKMKKNDNYIKKRKTARKISTVRTRRS